MNDDKLNSMDVEISYLKLVDGDYVDTRCVVTVEANSIEHALDIADDIGYKNYSAYFTGAIKVVDSEGI